MASQYDKSGVKSNIKEVDYLEKGKEKKPVYIIKHKKAGKENIVWCKPSELTIDSSDVGENIVKGIKEIKVIRISTKEPSANTGQLLTNNSSIYYGDVLSVSITANDSHQLDTPSNYTIDVKENNVTVKPEASIRVFQVTFYCKDGRTQTQHINYGSSPVTLPPVSAPNSEFTYYWEDTIKTTPIVDHKTYWEQQRTRDYTVTFEVVGGDNYGKMSLWNNDNKITQVTGVPYGYTFFPWSGTHNFLDIRKDNNIHATLRINVSPPTKPYDYSFNRWEYPAGGVTGDTLVKVHINQTIRNYVVSFSVNNSNYGSIVDSWGLTINSLTLPWGSHIGDGGSGKLINQDEYILAFAPLKSPPADTQYNFIGFNIPGSSGGWREVNANFTITASFEASYKVVYMLQKNNSASEKYIESWVNYGNSAPSYHVSVNTNKHYYTSMELEKFSGWDNLNPVYSPRTVYGQVLRLVTVLPSNLVYPGTIHFNNIDTLSKSFYIYPTTRYSVSNNLILTSDTNGDLEIKGIEYNPTYTHYVAKFSHWYAAGITLGGSGVYFPIGPVDITAVFNTWNINFPEMSGIFSVVDSWGYLNYKATFYNPNKFGITLSISDPEQVFWDDGNIRVIDIDAEKSFTINYTSYIKHNSNITYYFDFYAGGRINEIGKNLRVTRTYTIMHAAGS